LCRCVLFGLFSAAAVAVAMFVSRRNVVTGQVEWVLRDGPHREQEEEGEEEEDTQAEAEGTMHLDMLNDAERNLRYLEALREKLSRPQRVLDIGTGSGLLAMLAAHHGGATDVTACEVFPAIAQAARTVVAANGLEGRVRVLAKRSDAMRMPEDMGARAQLVVTEIFDSDLLGEGMLPSIRHALRELLVAPGAVVIPARAIVYAQFVQCEPLWKAHDLRSCKTPGPCGHHLVDPGEAAKCAGASSALCVQASTLWQQHQLTPLGDAPFAALTVDFQNPPAPDVVHSTTATLTAGAPGGVAHALLYWWDLYLTDSVVLSTAPIWARTSDHRTSTVKGTPTAANDLFGWRDHWMQSVCYLREPLQAPAGDIVVVTAHHDDYAIWFDVDRNEPYTPGPPICTCLNHALLMPERIRTLNDPSRWATIQAAMAASTTAAALQPIVALQLDDGLTTSLLLLEQVSNATATTVEASSLAAFNLNKRLIALNGLSSRLTCTDKDLSSLGALLPCGIVSSFYSIHLFQCRPVNMIVAEPFYRAFQRDLPWKSVLHYWHTKTQIQGLVATPCAYLLERARVRCAAAHFDHLFISHTRVNKVLDLDVSSFNRMCGGIDASPEHFSTTCLAYNAGMYSYQLTSDPVRCPFVILILLTFFFFSFVCLF